jgi:uncharacterized protein YukE
MAVSSAQTVRNCQARFRRRCVTLLRMATPLDIEPELLAETSRALRAQQAQLSALRGALTQHWARLDAGFRSYARAPLDDEYADADRALARADEHLRQCAVTLLLCVNALARADAQAARGFDETAPNTG